MNKLPAAVPSVTDTGATEKEPPTDSSNVTETAPPAPSPVTSDFIIDSGVLVAYTGYDTEITIPSDVKEIASHAFYEAPSAHEATVINLNSEVEKIDELAFAGLDSLEEINVPEDNEFYEFVDGVLMSTDGTLYIDLTRNSGKDAWKFIEAIREMEKNVDLYDKEMKVVIDDAVLEIFMEKHTEYDVNSELIEVGKYFIKSLTSHGYTFDFIKDDPDHHWHPDYYPDCDDKEYYPNIIGNKAYYFLSTDIGFVFNLNTNDNLLIFTDDGIIEKYQERIYFEYPEVNKEHYSRFESFHDLWYLDSTYYYDIDDDGRLVYERRPKKYMYTQFAYSMLDYCVSRDEFAKEEGYVIIEDGELKYIPEKRYTAGEVYDLDKEFKECQTYELETIESYSECAEHVTYDEYGRRFIYGFPLDMTLDEYLEYNSQRYERVFAE